MQENSLFEKLETKILQGDIVSLSKAITLNESTLLEDNKIVDQIISRHTDKLNQSLVISISGIPGVGKSSFINVLGTYLHDLGKSIAVFSIDPSSEYTRGSILGDKTRMQDLSKLDNVFIRPSPSSNKLGGLGINTHKNIELAKIAGFEIILVETVGVGQSETLVKNLCDVFFLLLMPASGDELQGIKKGIMEAADIFIIHKADGDVEHLAAKSKKEIELALHLVGKDEQDGQRIFSFSSVKKQGLDEIWTSTNELINRKIADGSWNSNRINQRIYWLKDSFESYLLKYYTEKHRPQFEVLKEKLTNGEYVGIEEIRGLTN